MDASGDVRSIVKKKDEKGTNEYEEIFFVSRKL